MNYNNYNNKITIITSVTSGATCRLCNYSTNPVVTGKLPPWCFEWRLSFVGPNPALIPPLGSSRYRLTPRHYITYIIWLYIIIIIIIREKRAVITRLSGAGSGPGSTACLASGWWSHGLDDWLEYIIVLTIIQRGLYLSATSCCHAGPVLSSNSFLSSLSLHTYRNISK